MPKVRDQAIMRLRRRRGMMAQIAHELGITEATVGLWHQIPLHHVFAVAAIARIPVEQLRPDFFINDPLRQRSIPRELRPRQQRQWPGGWQKHQSTSRVSMPGNPL